MCSLPPPLHKGEHQEDVRTMHTEHLVLPNCAPVAQVSGQARSEAQAHGCGVQVASGSGDHGGYSEEGEWEEEHSNRGQRDGDAFPPVQFASQNAVLMC